LPRDLSAFEIEAFFNFSDTERRVIEDRPGPSLKLAWALQISLLRMTGRLLEAVHLVASGGLDLGRRATKQSTTPRVPKLGTIFSSLDRLSPYEHRNVPLFGEERG
jgi:hypothetical protein